MLILLVKEQIKLVMEHLYIRNIKENQLIYSEIARMELNDRSIPFPLKIKRPIGLLILYDMKSFDPMRTGFYDAT